MNSLADRQYVKRFDFTSDAYPDRVEAGTTVPKFEVVSMEGYESISRPFRFTLTLATSDPSVDFDKLLKSTCVFKIWEPDGRWASPYTGILEEFEQLKKAGGYYYYRAVLVPPMYELSRRRTSKVYADKTIPDIIKEVCDPLHPILHLKDPATYLKRCFVYQYQESDLDFISRCMEKEGMAYYFQPSKAGDKMVIIDDKIKLPPVPTEVTFISESDNDAGPHNGAVQSFVCRQKRLPQYLTLQGYDYNKSDLQPPISNTITVTVSTEGAGEITVHETGFTNFDHGSPFDLKKELGRYAQIRAEEIYSGGKVFYGEATVVGLRSGYLVHLTGHYHEDFNEKQYLITEIRHEGSQANFLLSDTNTPYEGNQKGIVYRNQFSAILANTQFRPHRETPQPKIVGTMSAFVVATDKNSKYADLDDLGRYMVKLVFGGIESKARIRMASPYSSPSTDSGLASGIHFPLHDKTEVLLAFTDGNPDEPVIIAAVPNSENLNVVTGSNNCDSIIRTKGGNSLTMHDEAGKEGVWLDSPFCKGHFGIGAAPDKGYAAMMSDAFKGIIKGTSSTAVLGSRNTLTAGGTNSFNFGWGTKFSLGTSTTVNAMVAPVVLNMAPTLPQAIPLLGGEKPGITIDDTKTYKLSENASQTLLREYKLSVGYSNDREESLNKIQDIKQSLKTMINVGTMASMVRATILTEAQKGNLEGFGSFWNAFGGLLSLPQSVLFFAMNKLITRKLPSLMDRCHDEMASHLKMNNGGITLNTSPNANIYNEVLLDKEGLTLKSAENRSAASSDPSSQKDPTRSEMQISLGKVIFKAGTKVEGSAGGEIELEGGKSISLSAGEKKSSVLMMDANEFRLRKDSESPSILSLKKDASLFCHGDKLAWVGAAKTYSTVSYGGNGFTVGSVSARIQFGGQEFSVKNSGIYLNGELIKLG